MKKQNLGQKIYLIVQNPFHSIENYKTQEHLKNSRSANLTKHINYKHRKKILAKQQTLCLKKYLYAATNLNSIL